MSAGSLAADFTVPFFGALMCVTPAVTRPTVQFGVRVPAERTSATVISTQRRAYYWRTAPIGICCTIAARLLQGHGSWWLTRVILLLEVAADLSCVVVARKNITAAKNAEHWFAGLRQTVVIGVLRYPGLPARLAVGLATPGRSVPESVVSAFAVVAGQLYVTILWTGLTLLIYRSRPDIEAADPAASMSFPPDRQQVR